MNVTVKRCKKTSALYPAENTTSWRVTIKIGQETAVFHLYSSSWGPDLAPTDAMGILKDICRGSANESYPRYLEETGNDRQLGRKTAYLLWHYEHGISTRMASLMGIDAFYAWLYEGD